MLFLMPAIALAASDGPPPRPAKVQEPPQSHSSEPKPPAKTEQQPANEPSAAVKPIPANQNQEKSADKPKKADDKASADWWMVWLTGVLAFIAFLQLIVFGKQAARLRETIDTMRELGEKQSEDMLRSIKASETSASAAMNSVKVSEDTAERELRAYVYTDELTIFIEVKDNTIFASVQVQLRNFGKTPAYRVRHATYIEKLICPIPSDYEARFSNWAEIPEAGIAPSHCMYRREALPEDPVFDLDQDEMYYLFGLVKYFDAFGKVERTTRYCLGIFIKEFRETHAAEIDKQRRLGGPAIKGPAIFQIASIHNEAD